MRRIQLQKSFLSSPIAFICNLALVYIVYGICRLAYLLENWSVLSEGFDTLSFWEAFKGCWMFDTSAILYTNVLYAILMLIPLHWKEKDGWQLMTKWVYVVVNAVCVVANLADAVYFQYTGRRTTSSVFQEFSHEGNIGDVMGVELLRHWYLVLLGVVLIAGLIVLYVRPRGEFHLRMLKDKLLYYVIQLVCFGLYIPITVAGMRGGATTAVRPITISNANQYVNRPAEAALILNTPFSMIRTINKNVFADPQYFSREELDTIYSPIHQPADSVMMLPDSVMVATGDLGMRKKNVVVFIMESYGKEYIGAYNQHLDGGTYKGYAPFTDSLISRSLTFDYSFANGRKSIDGMPSILSSIPRFIEPFFLTPASMNEVSGLAGELGKVGYESAFFHGAENGSMGFEAFAKATGYQKYLGRTEYNQDKRFNGDKDFDGMWAIWDEEFLQFYALKMSEMKEPFITSVFTASSHHPYVVPERYKDIYKDEPGDDNIMHKCIRYVDHALRLFFETAEKQPWYKNTIFVLTADHTNLTSRPEYQTELGVCSVPLLIFDPSGEIRPERRHCIAQQIDIMPTILGYLRYDKPYVAFGQDLFNTADQDTWAVTNNNGLYHYVKGDHVLLFTESGQTKAIYNYKEDWFLKKNLLGKTGQVEKQMEREVKGLIQSYMERMTEDRLTMKTSK
ncbi:MAG: sulfatase-like hydrolase/transferase [Bacteroidaceae bacterium]|nr:sulfatase-like hydrolase/transferase [Bacteroidaceae bacterium]